MNTDISSDDGSRNRLFALICGLFLLIAIPCVLLAVWARNASRRVEQQLADLRATGAPTSLTELNEFYALPAGATDTTQLWIKAIEPFGTEQFAQDCVGVPVVGDVTTGLTDEGNAELASDDFSSVELPDEPEMPPELAPPGQHWAYRARAERLLEEYSASMELLQRATDDDGCARFEFDWRADHVSQLIELIQPLRTAGRMYTLQCYVHAHEGDRAKTTASLQTALRLSRSSVPKMTWVGQLVGYAITGMACENLIELVPHLDLSDGQLASLQAELRQTEGLAEFRCALQGERAWGLDALQDPRSNEIQLPQLPFFRSDNVEFYLRLMGELDQAAAQGWPQLFATSERLATEMTDLLSGLNRIRYGPSAMVGDSLDTMVKAAARGEMLRALVDTRLALQRYYLATGEYPDTLEALVPNYLLAVPTDVFVNRPIRYALVGERFRLWSVGMDGIDDGGVNGGYEGDIVVTSTGADE